MAARRVAALVASLALWHVGLQRCASAAATTDAVIAAAESEALCAAGSGGFEGCQRPPLGAGNLEVPRRLHPWPTARGGLAGDFGTSRHGGPEDLAASFTWSWHDPRGRFSNVFNGGIVIDDQFNLYTAATDGLFKLSPDGELVWTRKGNYSAAPVLAGNVLYGDSKDGYVYAVDIDSGKDLWVTTVAPMIGGDCRSVGVSNGVVVSAAEGQIIGGNAVVVGLDAADGRVMWRFKPDSQLWNFMPMFDDNGTVVFQDQLGGAYRVRLADGEQLWKAGHSGGWDESWTDGMSWLGPNGVVYVVHVDATMMHIKSYSPSTLSAFRLSDGEPLWQVQFPHPANSQPVVARLGASAKFSVVMPVGVQAGAPALIGAIFGAYEGRWIGIFMALACVLVLCCCRCRGRKFAFCTWMGSMAGCILGGIALGAVLGYIKWLQEHESSFPGFLAVMDAETGAMQWQYFFPVWEYSFTRGDALALVPRFIQGAQPLCVPNGWGSPSVDANGTVFVGHQNGLIYAIRDANYDGVINESEVSTFDMGSSSTHFGGAHAKGMLAWASCDSVFVFRW